MGGSPCRNWAVEPASEPGLRGLTFAVAREGGGLDRLVAELRPLAPALVVLEASGGFGVAVAAALSAKRVRPEPRPVAGEEAQAPAELVARSRRIVEMIGMEANRRRQARSAKVHRTKKATLRALEAQLAELDRDLGDAVRSPPVWRIRSSYPPPRRVPVTSPSAS